VCESETYLSQINNFDSLMRSVCTHTQTISPPTNAHPPIHTHHHTLTLTRPHADTHTHTHTRTHTRPPTLLHPSPQTTHTTPHSHTHTLAPHQHTHHGNVILAYTFSCTHARMHARTLARMHTSTHAHTHAVGMPTTSRVTRVLSHAPHGFTVILDSPGTRDNVYTSCKSRGQEDCLSKCTHRLCIYAHLDVQHVKTHSCPCPTNTGSPSFCLTV
jgi:hypothetical protein